MTTLWSAKKLWNSDLVLVQLISNKSLANAPTALNPACKLDKKVLPGALGRNTHDILC